MKIFIGILSVAAVFFAAYFFLVPVLQNGRENAVTNFRECAEAGNPIMESYPRQCRTPEGELFTEELGNALEKSDLIRLESPQAGDEIGSPLTVRGEARGNWFFEASFPIVLTDWDGKIIAESHAQAKSEWMTEDFVPFEGTLVFEAPDKTAVSNRGALILKKDNPSGLPRNDDALEIPIMFKKENQVSATAAVQNEKSVSRAVFSTSLGDITLEFFPTRAPQTVENFLTLARDGFYDGTKFHRVIKGFMIQGGDPLSKDDTRKSVWGTGGPGYKFADEIKAENKNVIGTIAMANSGPNTNGSQFFINTADNTFLDGKHTVFGKVIAGMDVVRKIESSPTGNADQPLQNITITRVIVSAVDKTP